MLTAEKTVTPQALVENLTQLISLPELYLRLQKTIDDPTHTREAVAEILGHDPALCARVLRIANSAYYGFPREIDTIDDAVGLIGETDLRNLVLATSVVGAMNGVPYAGIDIDRFWEHSLLTGIGGRLIGRRLNGIDTENLFLGGLLHDIGRLVIYQWDAPLAAAVQRQSEERHQLPDQAEREVLGFDHAEVGALLLETWDLPQELAEMARCHHQYQLARGDSHFAVLVLALANALGNGEDPEDVGPRVLVEALEIGNVAMQDIIEQRDQQFAEIRNLLLA